jgi:hypothetical protein
VERFGRNVEAYRRGSYNETQVRREFIDPLFKALGWDIDNESGYAEAYKDVIHEDAIKVGGVTKAPDYCFRVGGTRKFFVEAKKPAVNIKADVEPAFQLRRYAWSAKLPLSILTDFEEFAVYDCRVRPDKNDGATVARTIYLPYTSYDEKWDEIASIFSKEAVLQGSFDKYAETTKGKKGTAEVDAAFLKEIEEWRDLLAHNLALRNPSLTQRELNYAVQATIDRLIFLRICEDRGVEDYGGLQALLNGAQTYPRLLGLYTKADHRYNSGLFHFEQERGRNEGPDTLTPGLTIDDKALKDIIRRMYYPDSPYEFSVLPADILGQVYEQFLGKVIRLTAGHHAVVEDKPEVKKAGGVYYTPTYIVDYIVKNTVGKLLEGLTPKKASVLRILDPACGSGSFLIGAYQYLLDWHRDWYIGDGPKRHTKELFTGPGGEWRLTTSEKKRILLNSIYGVDIDAQAVETTKLSLLLKVLEGETAETINSQLSFLHERALPDLAENIKCGNSLVGPDFYDDQQLGMTLFNDEELCRINAFDWEAEFSLVVGRAVPEKRRGFDAVIGNPPWGARIDKVQRSYLAARHPDVADYESSQFFLMRCLDLVTHGGHLGMILPNTFALNVYARKCRAALLEHGCVAGLVDLSDVDVFAGPSVRSMLLLVTCDGSDEGWGGRFVGQPPHYAQARAVLRKQLMEAETWQWAMSEETDLSRLIDRLVERYGKLAEVCEVRQGYIPYRTTTLTARFGTAKATEIVKKRLWHACEQLGPEYLRELQGADVDRYSLRWSGTWVRYGEWVSTYLPVDEVFSGPRVLLREITGKMPHVLLATFTDEVFVHNPGVLAVLSRDGQVSPKFVLGVLNSRLASATFAQLAPKAKKGLFPKVIISDARRLPFPAVDVGTPGGRHVHDELTRFVEQMLSLAIQREKTSMATDAALVDRQMVALNRKIDILVYGLYGLTEDEIITVESGSERAIASRIVAG